MVVEFAARIGPILGFLVCITVVAELADGLGVFRTAAGGLARLARGSVPALWLLVVALAVVATAVLSLDTTAVLLTPVVLALAGQLELDRALFAYTTVWLANTASLFLPVSNLTNLLSVSGLGGLRGHQFAGLMWPAATACVAVTVLGLVIVFRKSLRGRYAMGGPEPVPNRAGLVLGTVVCALTGPAFLFANVFAVAAGAALILLVICAVTQRSLLRWNLVPWRMVAIVGALFVVVQIGHSLGLATLLGFAAGNGVTGLEQLRTAAVGAAGANLINNLPAYLAVEPVVRDSAARLAALLVGVNAGPLITPWASLATLLWAGRCRSAGVSVSWRRYALRGVVLVPCLLVAAIGAQVAAGR